MSLSCGIDFGTSNSTITVVEDGQVQPLPLSDGADPLAVPTIMHFVRGQAPSFGSSAIARYVAHDYTGRLVQSIKRHLPSKAFTGTWIAGRTRSIEELIGSYLAWLKERAEQVTEAPIDRVVLGRPARYHSDPQRDALAQSRMEKAARTAGFREVAFQIEPIAAARDFEQQLDRDVLCLVGDFGGGTSDFTVIRLSPDRIGTRDRSGDVLGIAGVNVGGNDFDTRLMQKRVLGHLGHGTQYRPLLQELPIPSFLHLAITRWHTLFLAASRENLRSLDKWLETARDREGLLRLREILVENMGFLLFQSIERTKQVLSSSPSAIMRFDPGSFQIEEEISLQQFEVAIDREVEKLERCVDGLLQAQGLEPDDITTVFLTGGSSRIPRIRQIFTQRFGDRLVARGSLSAVGHGLGIEASTQFEGHG